jgi:hypothetical protein
MSEVMLVENQVLNKYCARFNKNQYDENHRDQFVSTIGEETISNYIYGRYVELLKKTT